MKDKCLLTIKSQIETRTRSFLIDSQKNNKDFPDIMQGLMLRSDATTYCKNLKKSYLELKDNFNRLNENFDLSENEFNNLVDEITMNVLGEFIDLTESDFDENENEMPF